MVHCPYNAELLSCHVSASLVHHCIVYAVQVRLKDERLRQLRGAIKALEGKLAQLLKDKTDL